MKMIDDMQRHDEIMEELKALIPEEMESERALQLIGEAMRVAPRTMAVKLRQAGILPPAVWVDDDGEVFYTAEQLAEWFKIPIREALRGCRVERLHRIQ